MPPKTKAKTTTKPEKPPVSLVGTVDDTYLWGGILADVLEHVPELAWPTSIETYSHMRRDPALTAVIDGYSLQLRRAQWQLDGRGCRDEVVKLVADDLGLPVADAEEEPTGARTRGLSWNEHLRAALLSLVYGHMPFEIAAEFREGKARLTTVAERMPHTIEQIHIDVNTGELKGITQRLGKHLGVPEISAKNMVWYAHNREGISWQGTSLLRPAYGSWLFKREMIRAHAIANRRWSAGVPTMEALPGTVATTAQMEQAQRMASAARAGDQAGVAVPPGFRFVIAGVTGSLPDTLGFIKWLDQQMSRAVLMGHLDLGQTETGSRALGQSFIEYLVLSLEAIAEHIADVATRQMVARLVAWNWGEDEPVPLIRAAGVGSRRDVTAESLQMLMASGALSSDPGLEEWIRKEYRLPERTEPRADSQEGKQIAMGMSIELAKATKPEPGAPGAPVKPGAAAKPGDKAKTSDKKTPVGVKPGKATPKTAVKANAWEEAKHPRDGEGKFADRPGSPAYWERRRSDRDKWTAARKAGFPEGPDQEAAFYDWKRAAEREDKKARSSEAYRPDVLGPQGEFDSPVLWRTFPTSATPDEMMDPALQVAATEEVFGGLGQWFGPYSMASPYSSDDQVVVGVRFRQADYDQLGSQDDSAGDIARKPMQVAVVAMQVQLDGEIHTLDVKPGLTTWTASPDDDEDDVEASTGETVVLAHLPGQHDQKTHGRRTGAAKARRERAQAGKRVAGKDVMGWARDLTADGNATNELVGGERDFGDPRDRELAAIGAHQGFNGAPAVGDVDAEVKAGGVEMWRGVVPFKGSSTAAARSADDLVGGFRSGDYEPGTGIYGNGFYFSASDRVAGYYAEGATTKKRQKVTDGRTFRAALRADARVIDYDDVKVEYQAWRERIAPQTQTITDLYASGFKTPAGQYSPHLVDSVANDPGRFAALMGYDAVRVTDRQDGAPAVAGEPTAKHPDSGHRFSAHTQYVLLNRTAVVVEAV